MIKTMKYKIKYDKQLYSLLKEIQYSTFRMKNRAITMAWDWQQFSFSYMSRFEKWPRERETIGQSLKQDIYHEVKEWNKGYNSLFCDASIRVALDDFKRNKKKILKGEESIISYKKNGAFPIRASQIKHLERINKKKYCAKLSILASAKAKELGVQTQLKVILEAGGGANAIMDRVIDETYELVDSKIGYRKQKNEFYLLMSYKLEKQEIYLNQNRVMGIDLGINNPATISINDILYSTKFVGSKDEIINFENQLRTKKKRLQQSRKWAGKGSTGHGVKTRIKPLENLKSKISNYKSTKNHVWSKYIVDYAVLNGVSLIQMEDLSGINEGNKFLKRWTYYDLQQKITYKAEEYGIEVIRVNPNHTSARCNCCGAIHRDRDKNIWRKTATKFYCMNCNYKGNADANASKNLTVKDIDKVIKQEKDKWFKKFDAMHFNDSVRA